MHAYKELLRANVKLSSIKPRINKESCSYSPSEMFIIPLTGARVSIDGSLDLMNTIIQKLSSTRKHLKILKHFEEERKQTMYYK